MAINDLYVIVGLISNIAMVFIMVTMYYSEKKTNLDIHKTLKEIENHNENMEQHLETVSQVAASKDK